jgi:hypothetical protein
MDDYIMPNMYRASTIDRNGPIVCFVHIAPIPTSAYLLETQPETKSVIGNSVHGPLAIKNPPSVMKAGNKGDA